MDLYIFPEAACMKGGYGIAVKYAYEKLQPKKDDVIVWLTSFEKKDMLYLRPNDFVFTRDKLLSFKSINNILHSRSRSEFVEDDFCFLKNQHFNTIHCDEVIFYRALRAVFPDKYINVRFHNCFSRIYTRNSFLNRHVGLKYAYGMKIMKKLEEEIFCDRKVRKIFITEEDYNYYNSVSGSNNDSELWLIQPNKDIIRNNRKDFYLDNKLVWFGGIEAHKEESVKWFITTVFSELKKNNPAIEFHLYGKNSEKFNNPSSNIFGHGFFNGSGFPMDNCLYVNPDIIGGGVKIKLLSLLENGIPFISTPFGFEGYSKDIIDGVFCSVIDDSSWTEAIENLLRKYCLKTGV